MKKVERRDSMRFGMLKYDEIRGLVEQYKRVFKVQERGGKVLMSYRLVMPEIYEENPILREVRGLVFDLETGEIVQRPFHKFFNFGERLCSVSEDDVGVVVEKLDGSMIAATWYEDGLFINTTRSLCNEFIDKARRFIERRGEYEELIRDYEGYTVLFEYLLPEHQIVIPHEKEELVLLAIRDKKTGKYISQSEVDEIAKQYGIPRPKVECIDRIGNIVPKVKVRENTEGVVVYTEKDLVKVKTDWYIERHKVRTKSIKKVDVVKWFFENELDDVYPLLNDEQKRYVDGVVKEIYEKLDYYMGIIESVDYSIRDRREFAMHVKQKVPREAQWICFRKYDNSGFNVYDGLKKVLVTLYSR